MLSCNFQLLFQSQCKYPLLKCPQSTSSYSFDHSLLIYLLTSYFPTRLKGPLPEFRSHGGTVLICFITVSSDPDSCLKQSKCSIIFLEWVRVRFVYAISCVSLALPQCLAHNRCSTKIYSMSKLTGLWDIPFLGPLPRLSTLNINIYPTVCWNILLPWGVCMRTI